METSINLLSIGKLIRIQANAAAHDFAERVAREPLIFSAASPVHVHYQGDIQNGFGATHLLWKMAGNTRAYTDQRVLAISAQQMSMQLEREGSDRMRSSFGASYVYAHALFIDDIGYLSGRAESQAAIGIIVERLLSGGGSLAFTGFPPEDMRWKDSSLGAMIGCSTRICVGRPGIEDLLTILRQKLIEIGVPVPDEVLDRAVVMLARTEDWNLREAVGLLIKTIATANWTGRALTAELVGKVYRSMLS